MANYFIYHLHTELSLLDSCTNHKLYADKASELGMKAICYSEHGNIYSWVEKKMYANSKGLKYIHGCEVYLTEKLYWEPDADHKTKYKVRDNYHTVLIAKNYEGVKELNALISISSDEDHKYYNPRITFEEFFGISDNIIKISACLASPLNKMRDRLNEDVYKKLLQTYDYYEIQPHINQNQIEYNKYLYELSKEYNKPLIAGTDTHSINDYKAECRKILKRAKKMSWDDEDTFDLTFKSYDELVGLFELQNALPKDVFLQAIENTNVVESMCEDFELDLSFKYPVLYEDEETVMWDRIKRMYQEKVDKGIIQDDPRYMQRIEEEMAVFKKINMVGFMLFMSELCCWCWDNDIPVGYGRGSVGGSMVAYITDIIDVNPLIWDTVFSRFANEYRKEIGDIDLDICPDQRELVYDHIIEKFGYDKTAYILAIGTIAEKGVIDEIGRALAILWDEKNPGRKDNPYSLDIIARIKKEYDTDAEGTKKKYPDLFYYFDGLLNTAISQSMHPAGIVVSPVTLPDGYGVFWSEGKEILNINMEEIHEISLVKYDILGLKSLSVIRDACKYANIPFPKSHKVNWDDDKVWEHIIDSPVGIFQFEGNYAFELLKKFKPHKINDLSLVNASLRPSGASYRDRLIAREINHNPSEMIDDLLKANNGYLVYQEDTIKFLMYICGMNGSDADNIRRAIGRKQKDRIEAALPTILNGYCSKSNKPRDIAEKEALVFLHIIEDSSDYQFGYNHSSTYSFLGYVCAYLRYYYPKEFITSYLNNANNDADIQSGTSLAKQLHIPIHSIKFGKSGGKYTCAEDGIYKGIGSIKYLGEDTGEELYNLHKEHFDTFVDLLEKIKSDTTVNSKQLDILIKLDFFSEFGDINYLLKIVDLYNTFSKRKQFPKTDIDTFGVEPEVILKYVGKETAKLYKEVDTTGLLKELISTIEYKPITILEHIKYESELLGYITYKDKSTPKTDFFVESISSNRAVIKIKLFNLHSGKEVSVNIWNNAFNKKPFEVGAILRLIKVEKKFKKEPTGEINPTTGKKIYKDVPNEYEYWLVGYENVSDEY